MRNTTEGGVNTAECVIPLRCLNSTTNITVINNDRSRLMLNVSVYSLMESIRPFRWRVTLMSRQ